MGKSSQRVRWLAKAHGAVPSGVEQEGISRAFAADGRGGTVPGIDLGGIGEGQEFLLDALEQGFPTAAREVGAAHAVAKQHVSTQQGVLGFGVKAEAVRRMTGEVKRQPGAAEEGELGQIPQQLSDGKRRHRHARAGEGSVEFFQGEISGVGGKGIDWAIVGAGQFGGVHDVIEMLVSEQQSGEWDALFGDPSSHAFRGIHRDGSVFVAEEVTVGLSDPASKKG